jgi:acetate kinase
MIVAVLPRDPTLCRDLAMRCLQRSCGLRRAQHTEGRSAHVIQPSGRKPARLLTINPGSSSLRVGLYRMGDEERRGFTVSAERIGAPGGRLTISDDAGARLLDRRADFPDHAAALDALFAWLRGRGDAGAFDAAGQRIVYGGLRYRAPERITPEMIDALRQLTEIDPDHLPQSLDVIEAVGRAYPDVPQVACFDTAFHLRMPPVATRYALPPEYAAQGVIRYGFHGLSYEYIMEALRAIDPAAAEGKIVIAHLGNGASMAAVRGGVGIDTTMGFSPTGGLMMGTRTGDLDPAVPLFLLRSGMSAAEVSMLVNARGGMAGVSGTSGDMRDLLAREATGPRAAQAVALFCYTAKKYLGALAATLDGLETLVFTGGIGEHAASVRERVCAGLGFLGIALDPARNAAHAPVISRDGGAATVRVIPTNEEVMIARHTERVITEGGAP